MEKPYKYLTGLFSVFIIAVLLVGCNSETNTASSKRGEEKSIKVKIALNGKMNPLTIGQEKGWFEEEFAPLNAEIEWSEFKAGASTSRIASC